MLLATSAAEPQVMQFLLVVKITLVALLIVAGALLIRSRGQLRATPAAHLARPLPRLVYLAAVAAVFALAGTSLVALWRFSGLHGWWLMAHMMSAGVFLAAVALTALFLSARLAGPGLAAAICYALMLVFSLGVMGTILLSMLPLFGTEDMRGLINLHRYAGLGLLTATVLHGVLRFTR